MITFEFDRDGAVEGTCDMVVVEHDTDLPIHLQDRHECDGDAVIQFIEDGEPRQFCREHGRSRVTNLATSGKIYDVYCNE